MAWIIGLRDQRKLLRTQLLLDLDQLRERPGSILELIHGFQRVDGGDVAVLEPDQQVGEVLVGVLDVLSDQEEVRLEGADHLVAGLGQDDRGRDPAVRRRRDAELLEFGLLDPDVELAVDALSPERKC